MLAPARGDRPCSRTESNPASSASQSLRYRVPHRPYLLHFLRRCRCRCPEVPWNSLPRTSFVSPRGASAQGNQGRMGASGELRRDCGRIRAQSEPQPTCWAGLSSAWLAVHPWLQVADGFAITTSRTAREQATRSQTVMPLAPIPGSMAF